MARAFLVLAGDRGVNGSRIGRGPDQHPRHVAEPVARCPKTPECGPMLTDVSEQVKWHGLTMPPDDCWFSWTRWAARCGSSRTSTERRFVSGRSSSGLSKSEMSDLMESLSRPSGPLTASRSLNLLKPPGKAGPQPGGAAGFPMSRVYLSGSARPMTPRPSRVRLPHLRNAGRQVLDHGPQDPGRARRGSWITASPWSAADGAEEQLVPLRSKTPARGKTKGDQALK